MKIATFWDIIERTQAEDDQEVQEELLLKELMLLEKEEIINFQEMFKRLKNKLPNSIFFNDREDPESSHWEISPLLKKLIDFGSYSSDYDYSDFKEWIVCQGQQTYIEALRTPEEFVIKSKYPYFYKLYFVAQRVLKEKYDL